MKKGALATTVAALGTGTAAAQDDGDDGSDGGDGGDGGASGSEVVVFGDDYQPGADFNVASSLDDGTRDELFDEIGASEEFDSPDDWDVYLINYDFGGSAPALGFLMTEEADLSAGDSETMGEDGSFRAADLDLVETSLDGGGGDGMDGDDGADSDGGDGMDGGDGADSDGGDGMDGGDGPGSDGDDDASS